MSSKGGECSPYPKFPSFLSQVLYALQVLQAEESYQNGVPLKAVAKFMKVNYGLTGDVVNQVKTSALGGVRRGLIVKGCGGRYVAVGAVAKVQLCEDLASREKLLRDVFEVFMNKSNAPPPADPPDIKSIKSGEDIFRLLDEYLKSTSCATKRKKCSGGGGARRVERRCTCQKRRVRSKKKVQCKDITVSSSSSSSKCSTKKCRKK